jgi:hypothetical protein
MHLSRTAIDPPAVPFDPEAGLKRLAAMRDEETAQAVVASSRSASFDSLRPRTDSAASAKASRLLAESAVRRLKRWSDPATGGLDADDRSGLLRQAEAYGLTQAVAEQVLIGVEAVWQVARPPSTATERPTAALPRRRLSWSVIVTSGVICLLAGMQIVMLMLWQGVIGG